MNYPTDRPVTLSLSSVLNNAEGASIINSIYYYLIGYCVIGLHIIALVSHQNSSLSHFFTVYGNFLSFFCYFFSVIIILYLRNKTLFYWPIAFGIIVLVSYLQKGFSPLFFVFVIFFTVNTANEFINGEFDNLAWMRKLIKFLICFSFILMAFFIFLATETLGSMSAVSLACFPPFAMSIWGYVILKKSNDNGQLNAEIRSRTAPWSMYREFHRKLFNPEERPIIDQIRKSIKKR